MITVSLNVGGGVRIIKPAKLYKDGRTAPGVRDHGSVPLGHAGNVVTRIRIYTHRVTHKA